MSDDRSFLAEELYRRYGAVKRARGPFLYTAKGVRLTDLYQEDGRAVLGWGGGSAFTMLKNALSRGATGSYITDYSFRLQKAVCDLLGDERIVLAFCDRRMLLSLSLALFPEGTSFYRPWLPSAPDWHTVPAVAVVPPLPVAEPYYLLALRRTEETEAALEGLLQERPSGAVRLSSHTEAALARSLYNLMQALQERREQDWFLYDTVLCRYWERRGPYLYPKVDAEQYRAFVTHCLDCGVVVNPAYNQPSIVPFGADAGVFAKLKARPFGGV